MFQYVVVCTLVFVPCLTHAAPSPERSEVIISIEKNPEFVQACIPCFEYIGSGASKPNVMAQNEESVLKGSFGGSAAAIPINNESDQDTDQRTNETGQQLRHSNHNISVYLNFILVLIISLLYEQVKKLKFEIYGYRLIFDNPPPSLNMRWDDNKRTWVSLS